MKTFSYSTVVLLLIVVNEVTSEMSHESSDKFMADLYSYVFACRNETGATDVDVEDMYNRALPTTKAAKCFNECVYQKLGITKDGNFVPDSLVKVIEMDKSGLKGINGKTLMESMPDINGECKNISDPDACEFAAKLRTCLNAAAKKREFCPNVF